MLTDSPNDGVGAESEPTAGRDASDAPLEPDAEWAEDESPEPADSCLVEVPEGVPEVGQGAVPAVPADLADEKADDAGSLELFAEPLPAGPEIPSPRPEQKLDVATRAVVVELRHIEDQVRRLLEERDPKRKRKLAGTRRWHELHEELINLRHSGRLSEETIESLERLIARRHFLFRQLRFYAGTRPTWNT
ncbi:MAG TPA: hypothetical protein PKK06_02810 [Phycisphaerae bacterium]|nr:hypothetical protein [Phycisphaerae bacterium]HNU44617.1 hypothetical protein [Phycisphaerae bacterium]